MTLDVQILTTTHESQTFDRKSARIDPKGLAVVLTAMANADGGCVAIGIEDNGTETGIDRYIVNVNNLLRVPMDYCVPRINVHPEYLECTNNNGDADNVLLLNVEQSNRHHATSADETYIRVGDKSHKMGFEERMQLMFAKGVCYFEDEPHGLALLYLPLYHHHQEDINHHLHQPPHHPTLHHHHFHHQNENKFCQFQKCLYFCN